MNTLINKCSPSTLCYNRIFNRVEYCVNTFIYNFTLPPSFSVVGCADGIQCRSHQCRVTLGPNTVLGFPLIISFSLYSSHCARYIGSTEPRHSVIQAYSRPLARMYAVSDKVLVRLNGAISVLPINIPSHTTDAIR